MLGKWAQASQQINRSQPVFLSSCTVLLSSCARKCSRSYILWSPVCATSSDGKAPHTLPVLFHNRRNSTDSAVVVLYNWFRCLTVHERMPLWAPSLTLPFWSSGHTINMLFIIQKHWSWTPLIRSHILGEIWKEIQQFDVLFLKKEVISLVSSCKSGFITTPKANADSRRGYL